MIDNSWVRVVCCCLVSPEPKARANTAMTLRANIFFGGSGGGHNERPSAGKHRRIQRFSGQIPGLRKGLAGIRKGLAGSLFRKQAESIGYPEKPSGLLSGPRGLGFGNVA